MNDRVRSCFPSLKRMHNGHPITFMDGPAGVQVPTEVINAISGYYENHNANVQGFFPTSRETDEILASSRNKVASFLGAENPDCISFGANMTSLAYSLSQGFRRIFSRGDEMLITQLDHEANRGPWLSLRESGVIVREINLLPNGKLDYEDMNHKINEKTKVIAVGYASNIFGTVNDLRKVREAADKVGAWLVVDGVHSAPHFRTDVQNIDCEFFLCSAYKFYGPHVGILYSKPGILSQIPTDRLKTQNQNPPLSIETGTLNHAAIAGVRACIEFIESFDPSGDIDNAFRHIGTHENSLAHILYKGLQSIDNVQVIGPDFSESRAPTIALTIEGKEPSEICTLLGNKGICAWDGHFYAIRATEVLGLLERGGVTRLGVSVYNTEAEIDRVVKEISIIASA